MDSHFQNILSFISKYDFMKLLKAGFYLNLLQFDFFISHFYNKFQLSVKVFKI